MRLFAGNKGFEDKLYAMAAREDRARTLRLAIAKIDGMLRSHGEQAKLLRELRRELHIEEDILL